MQLSIIVSAAVLVADAAARVIRDERTLDVRHCDCILPEGPCGCNAPREQVKVLARDLSPATVATAAPTYTPVMPGRPPGSRNLWDVRCLCIIENLDGSTRPCPCGVGRREQAPVLHCMCIVDLPNGTYKPCGCNSDVSFLGKIQPKPVDLTTVTASTK